MKKGLIVFMLMMTAALFAGGSVDYDVSFVNLDHHEVEISTTFSGIPGEVLEVRISRSSPGYYALFEFTKNIYNVKFFNSRGERLEFAHPNPHQWNVSGHDGTVVMTYILFGDYMDGTHTSIESRHVYLNIPSAFVWARGMEQYPVKVKINNPPKGWQILTQLMETEEPGLFAAPHLDYFIDSPIEIAPFILREWKMGEQRFRLGVHDNRFFGAPRRALLGEDVDLYLKMVKKVLHELEAIFGELPRGDYGSFTFISNHLEKAYYDGMEHRNSSVLATNRELKEDYIKNLQLLAHEAAHFWNGERLRPASLIPFNLEETNSSGELWFLEGFTSYLQDLVICRSGLISLEDYAEFLNKRLNFFLGMPGYQASSPVEVSLMAPLFNGAVYLDSTNKNNIYISYYYYGSVIALALDLSLRTKFSLGLDEYLQLVWRELGRKEVPYTNKDLERLLINLTGDRAWGETFFRDYIYGRQLPAFKELLARGGLLLRPQNPGKGVIGDMYFIRDKGGAVVVDSRILKNEPLYDSGLDYNDTILALGGREISSKKELEEVLAGHKPGEILWIRFRKPGGEVREKEITLGQELSFEIVPFETAGLEVTPEIEAFRVAWLGAKSPYPLEGVVKKVPGTTRTFPLTYNYCPYTGKKLEFAGTSPEKPWVIQELFSLKESGGDSR